MGVKLELPDTVLQQLETLASREGTTLVDLIQRMVEAHLDPRQQATERKQYVRLPLIPALETGPIPSMTGAEVDQILESGQLTS